MNNLPRALLAAAIALYSSLTLHAQTSDTQPASLPPSHFQNPDPARYLMEDQLSPGMKGFGLTVMHGGKIEKFDVEIIDIIHNFSPGQNAILVRCSGLGLEHSGIIAGMSGSPVYIQNKMIGAVAYGWGLSKDPIGGVQPIRQMLNIPTNQPLADNSSPSRWNNPNNLFTKQAALIPGYRALTTSLSHKNKTPIPQTSLSTPTGITPLASPLMASNASDSTLQLLRDAFAPSHLVPIASGSAGSTPTANDTQNLGGLAQLKPNDIQLEPGSAIAIPLISGDMDLSAIGTVTEVRDGKVYAFGHSFIGDGPTQVPIATSYIYTIFPNVSQSFKMGTSITSVGTLVSDHQTGIVGLTGKSPPTVPVTLTITHTAPNPDNASSSHTYHYQLAPHPHMTPEVLTAILNESLTAQLTLPHKFTARMTGNIAFSSSTGEKSLPLNALATTDTFNPILPLIPIALFTDNPFENLKLTAINLNIAIDPTDHSGEIQNISIDRLTAAPGDTLNAIATIKPSNQPITRISLSLQIPSDTPDGDYQLSIGSSSMALTEETAYAPQHFNPKDITALTDDIQHILSFQPDRLYAALILNISGATVAGHEFHNLPASRLALYASDRRTDTTPLLNVITKDIDAGAILSDGGQSFAIHIDKNANNRYFNPKPNHNPSMNNTDQSPRLPVTAPAPSPTSAPSPDEPTPGT